MTNKRLKKAIRKHTRDQKTDRFLGILGNGVGKVEITNRPGYHYVRLRDNQSEIIAAFNDLTAPVEDLPVFVERDGRDKSRWVVVARDKSRWDTWTSNYVPAHGNQHSFNRASQGGGDVVWVYGRQMMPLNAVPSGTVGSGNVVVQPFVYYQNNTWMYAGNTGTPDIVGFKPTDNTAKMVLVYLDADGHPLVDAGSTFDASITGTQQILPFIPTVPITDGIPVAGVRLVSGTSRIIWDNIYDLRPWIVGDGFISTGSFGHIIQDAGTPVTQRPSLNFVGDGLWVEDDVGNDSTNVIVSGSSGDGHTITFEGGDLPQQPNLAFQGISIWVTDEPSVNTTMVHVTGTPGIQDDGVPELRRGDLNFIGDGVLVEDDPSNKRTNIIITGSSSGGSPLTTKGDLYGHDGATDIRFPVGSTGDIILADSGQSSGLRWLNFKTAGFLYNLFASTTKGDIDGHNGVGFERVPIGTHKQVLSVNTGTATQISWLDDDELPQVSANLIQIGTNVGLINANIADIATNAEDISTNAYVAKTANYTALTSDKIIEVTANSPTITLYAASGNQGKVVSVHNSGSGRVLIDGNSSETINGETTYPVYPNETIRAFCNGTNWIII